MVRYRCAAPWPEKDTIEADLVSGIPDSASDTRWVCKRETHSLYAPVHEVYPDWPAASCPNQAVRDLVARMKLIPNRSIIQGNRLVFCDDSIVRGTQLKDNVKILFDYGAARSTCGWPVPPSSTRASF